MDILYSPWRLSYVSGDGAPAAGCVFCDALSRGPGPESLVVYGDPGAGVLLNRYPYNNGHLLVVPRVHVDSLTGVPPEVLARCTEILAACERVLREAYRCQGINMGLNLGEAAGAGIADHLHWHAVPRWRGDTNFMTALGGTRVVPEAMEATFARLRPLFDSALGPA